MPDLLCLKEGEDVCRSHEPISEDIAKKLLTELKCEHSVNQPKLSPGKNRHPTDPGFRPCDAYAVHLEAKLGKFAEGYYLLRARPETVESLIRP